MLRHLAIVGLLAVAVLGIYAPVRGFDYAFDDFDYLHRNDPVRSGLNAASLAWAATGVHSANWHPVTWTSHMLDVELFGLDEERAGLPSAGWHHLENVAWHALCAALLYAGLVGWTGAVWRSALVAALFAVHPLRVESVAWIFARKDLLSTALAFAAIGAYASWARRPTPGRYAAVAVLFALGLAAKPMVVTLPVLLLILDAWPLGRLGGPAELWPRVREKLPLFALSAAAAGITLHAQALSLAVNPVEALGVTARIANALHASALYLASAVWPAGLAVFYPHPYRFGGEGIALWRLAASGLLLAGITAAALRAARRPEHRYALAGWLWYIVALAPVIGLVQVGYQAAADRYTYLPLVGVFVALVWGAADALVGAAPGLRRAAAVGAVALLVAFAATARHQLQHWRDDRALFERALAVTPRNWLAHTNLGVALAREGDDEGAVRELERALAIHPGYFEARYDLGNALQRLGRLDAAVVEYEAALRIVPASTAARNNLALALALRGDLARAEAELRRVLEQDPGHAGARRNLDNVRRLRAAGPSGS